jgi:hypothetical protein
MNYLYSRVEEEALALRGTTPGRSALRKHMLELAEVLKAVEWEDSGDYGEGSSEATILEFLGRERLLESATEDAEKAMAELSKLLYGADGIGAVHE